jgi:hypothetical protein
MASIRNLIQRAIVSDIALRDTKAELHTLVEPHIKGKSAKAAQEWLLKNVANVIAETYSQQKSEGVLAYVSNRGTIAFKAAEGEAYERDGKSTGRNNASEAARKLYSYWFTQKGKKTAPAAPAWKRLLKTFDKLATADKRAFLRAINSAKAA